MRCTAGFTLVEVLVVLAIVGLLAAIAYPSYSTHIIKTRRTEGQVALLELMQQQERFYTDANTYIAFSSASTDPQERRFRWWSGSTAAGSAYEIHGDACPGLQISECIELSAVPGTERVNAAFTDSGCGTLTLSSTGAHAASGSEPRCWP